MTSATTSGSGPEQFVALLARVTGEIAGQPLDKALEARLNARFGADSDFYAEVVAAVGAGVAAGWICEREHGGLRYGRVAKPGPALHGFSIDVVDMPTMAGPHHVHPQGEIDLIMPLEGEAKFDGHPAGWLVYGPGSAHRPTVSDGRAWVLYLLPGGAIEFSRP